MRIGSTTNGFRTVFTEKFAQFAIENMKTIETGTSILRFILMVTGGILSAGIPEIHTPLGAAVNFYLPPFHICGRYNLSSPHDTRVIGIFNASYAQVGNLYSGRAAETFLSNGTVVLTLHYIQYNDEGTYQTIPEKPNRNDCWRSFVLTVEKDDPGFWLAWQPWTPCDTSCGPGRRTRIRACSKLKCYQGNSEDEQPCPGNLACPTPYEWTNWSDWSACSATCGTALRSHHRYCMNLNLQRVDNLYCQGQSYVEVFCPLAGCNEPVTSVQNTWTSWDTWSVCSQSCGTGLRTRARYCNDGQTVVEETRCVGDAVQQMPCENFPCTTTSETDFSDGLGATPPALGKTGVQTQDKTVTLPLSVIVGTAAAVCILILAVIIVVLVVKIKRKRKHAVKMAPDVQGHPTASRTKSYRKKDSVISQNISSTHVYDEINDSDVKSDARMSVITVDNPYVQMPRSASPTDNNDVTPKYGNMQETVFTFDPVKQGVYQNRKISTAYQNPDTTQRKDGNVNLEVPRHMSVDSVGYLMPGNKLERAEQRKRKYVKS